MYLTIYGDENKQFQTEYDQLSLLVTTFPFDVDRRLNNNKSYMSFEEACQKIIDKYTPNESYGLINDHKANKTLFDFIYNEFDYHVQASSSKYWRNLNILTWLEPIYSDFNEFIADMSVSFIQNKKKNQWFCQMTHIVPENAPIIDESNIDTIEDFLYVFLEKRWFKKDIHYITNWFKFRGILYENDIKSFMINALENLRERLSVYNAALEDVYRRLNNNFDAFVNFTTFDAAKQEKSIIETHQEEE